MDQIRHQYEPENLHHFFMADYGKAHVTIMEQVEHQVEPEGHREACQAEGLPEEPSEVQAVVEVLRQSW